MATWADYVLAVDDPPAEQAVVDAGFVERLVALLVADEWNVRKEACWAVSNVTAGTAEQKQAVIETGACQRLFEVLENRKSKNCLQNALHAVAIIAEGTVGQKQAIIDCDNALTTLRTFFDSPDDQLRQNAYTAITQITRGGSVDQIQAVIDAGIVSAIFEDELLTDDEELEIIRRNAATTISNIAMLGSPDQIKYLFLEQGCIPPLCELLKVADPKIVMVALEGLENILKVGNTESKQTGAIKLLKREVSCHTKVNI